VNAQLLFVLLYTIGLTALGVWMGRLVKLPADFFVAGRRLPAALLAATVLAANIGAGTTVGAAGLAYRDGLSAWWWNGAAGLGTLVLAFWVGPRLWALASARGYFTIGDFLEDRYGPSVRGTVAALLWLGTLAILAGQLIAGAAVLEVVAGTPKWMGVLIGGLAMTIYFTAGGLLSSAWVNAVQLTVLVAGFAVAVPMALASAGGWSGIAAAPGVHPSFWDPMHSIGPGSGWTLLLLLGPGFIVSPGLVQKAFGGVSARAVTVGIAAAAIAQLVFSFAPVLLGMAGRAIDPNIASQNLVLPTVLMHGLPPWLGALGLAAVFSAEVSTCDAILFMLATSLSKDLYQRFLNPSASPAQVLRVARGAALAGGAIGMVLAMQLGTVVDALRIFYSLLGTTLLVPVAAALLWPAAGTREALGGIIGGVGTLLAVHFGMERGGWADPSTWGLVGSAAGFLLASLTPRGSRRAEL